MTVPLVLAAAGVRRAAATRMAAGARRTLATEIGAESTAARPERRVRKEFADKMKAGPGFGEFVGGSSEPLT
ncbi:hypothetical protein H4R21_006780, partial [Coemansia helicoidea]